MTSESRAGRYGVTALQRYGIRHATARWLPSRASVKASVS